MNEIYNKAHEERGKRGKPIFLVNLKVSKTRFYGNSKKPHKTFSTIERKVSSGTIDQMKKDLKTQIFKLDNDYRIEEVEIISFHGYSHVQ